MTEPKLWSGSDTDATSLERELLVAGRNQRMPAADRQAGLARLLSAVPGSALSPSPSPSSPPAVTPSLVATPLAKGLVVCAGVAALAAAGLLRHHTRPPEPAPKQILSTATDIPRAAPETTSVAAVARSAASAPPPNSPVATGRVAPNARVGAESRLREESLLVLDVRRTLRAGDAASALARLAEADAKFPHGGLGQEREALLIEALFVSGKTSEAKRRAEAFLRAFPKSPYAEGVRELGRR
jgi:hypothetical protein